MKNIEDDYKLFRGGEVNVEIGDMVYDSRYEEWIEIVEQYQIRNYWFVAPELYCVAKPRERRK